MTFFLHGIKWCEYFSSDVFKKKYKQLFLNNLCLPPYLELYSEVPTMVHTMSIYLLGAAEQWQLGISSKNWDTKRRVMHVAFAKPQPLLFGKAARNMIQQHNIRYIFAFEKRLLSFSFIFVCKTFFSHSLFIDYFLCNYPSEVQYSNFRLVIIGLCTCLFI